MQKKFKENHLKSYAVRSVNTKGRVYKEQENSIRSPYQGIEIESFTHPLLEDSNTKPKFLLIVKVIIIGQYLHIQWRCLK